MPPRKKPAAAVASPDFYGDMLDGELDVVEKKFKLNGTAFYRDEKRLTTGLLSLDLILNGGIVSGGWYTVFGGEQSCKSTLAAWIMANIMKQEFHGTVSCFDYEGSVDNDYLTNILKSNKVKGTISDLFGQQDPETGEWIRRGKIRYYAPGAAEDFFDWMAGIQRRLPDKSLIGKDYYLLFDNTKENKKKVDAYCKSMGVEYDAMWFRKHNQYKVPAPDRYLQGLVLLDSYPAMLPEKQDEDDPGSAMAAQARMFSEQIKRVKANMRRKMFTVIGVNQLRLRPAVMFGCLHGSTKIPLVDGRSFTIQEIVENQIQGEVWSINEKTRELEPKKIIQWNYNGEVEKQEDWIKIVSRCPETGNGQAFVMVTPDHEILTDSGWKCAKNITPLDRLVSKYTSYRQGNTASFLNAIAAGDSCMVADSPNSGLMKLQDNLDPEYVQWKMDKLSMFDFSEYTASHNGDCYIARGSDFVAYSKHVPNREPWKLKFDDLSLAIHYMDDGHLHNKVGARWSFKRFKGDEVALQKITDLFSELGLEVSCNVNDGLFWLNKAESVDFFERIAHYIPDCMQRKLPEEYRGRYEDFELEVSEKQRPVYVEVLRVESGSKRAFRNRGKYDLSIEDNKNYIAGNKDNGVIVHNSPEYEPCGESLKFFSDCRLRMQARAPSGAPSGPSAVAIKGGPGLVEEKSVLGGKDTYRYISCKTHKNKLGGVPNQETWLRLWVSDANGQACGFDPVFDTYNFLKTLGWVSGTKANFKFAEHVPLHGAKKCGWDVFKVLVLGTKAQISEKCKEIGIKPVSIRLWCKKQIDNGKAFNAFKDILGGGDAATDDSEED